MSNIIFGPVLSRRFGKSLGIDLSPSKKQCNFDCLYCELKPAKTIDSYEDIVPVAIIIKELVEALKHHKDIDVITITANGEPTLYPHLDELIDEIDKIKGDKQTLILSNGSTIGKKEIQQTLCKLDVIKLSLDCVTQQCLKKLDRASKSIDIEDIKRGMLEFRATCTKPLIVEVLFVKNINDNPQEIEGLSRFLGLLQPTRIDIGTIDRPPAYKVEALSYEELREISQRFDKSLPIYIASRKTSDVRAESYSDYEILSTLSNRPLSIDDVDVLFDKETQKRLNILLKEQKIILKHHHGIYFYTLG